MNIFWFRRDLRLEDNKGLFEALNNGHQILPVFIFDTEILEQLPKDDSRVTFIHHQLSDINSQLKQIGKSLAVFYGKPARVFEKLLSENKIQTVFTNHDYEPYARKRDLEVYQIFKGHNVEFKTYKDQVIFEKDEVAKDDGLPYVVYTPYSKKWKDILSKIQHEYFASET